MTKIPFPKLEDCIDFEEPANELVISSDVCPLNQMGLDSEVYKVFLEAERMVLESRKLTDDDVKVDDVALQASIENLFGYLDIEKAKLLKAGRINSDELQEQFEVGIFYTIHVGFTGEIPVYDARYD